MIYLHAGVSPDKTIDALYAFTDCEISISPNACVIKENKPVFMGISQILRENTDYTTHLLKRELEILQKVRVEIKKLNPPIDGDVNFVSVVVEE